MFTVYALKSLKNGKRYVGFTSKDLKARLEWHARGLNQWTKTNGPFELIYWEEFPNKQIAQKREKYFKTGQGREVLDRLIQNKNKSTSATTALADARQ